MIITLKPSSNSIIFSERSWHDATFNIPVGISDFSEIRQNGYYYVDKTGLIAELLNNSAAKVTLITRPCRFGKTLGMSMLAAFFDIHKNSDTLFEGLEISKDTASCQKWMNQYPTLFLTFKDVDGLNFDDAYGQLVAQIADLYKVSLDYIAGRLN